MKMHDRGFKDHHAAMVEISNRNTDRFGQPLNAMGKATRKKAAGIVHRNIRKKTSHAKRGVNQI